MIAPPPFRPLFACRNNATLSLIELNGASRSERFCPRCIPLRHGLCCLLTERQTARRMREMKIVPFTLPPCAHCDKPNETPQFQNCPNCREIARRRMRRVRA